MVYNHNLQLPVHQRRDVISWYENARWPANAEVKGLSYSPRIGPKRVMGFRPGPRTGWWSGHRHLCLRSASLDPGREPRVGARAPRTWHCPGKLAARAARPGSWRSAAARWAPSHGSRARSQQEPGGIAIVFGWHINPRADPLRTQVSSRRPFGFL